jgi:hypothetical protein
MTDNRARVFPQAGLKLDDSSRNLYTAKNAKGALKKSCEAIEKTSSDIPIFL